MAEKRPTFGAIATIPSIQTVQIMARSGIDWIIVDLETRPDRSRLRACDDHGDRWNTLCADGADCRNGALAGEAPMDLGALGIKFSDDL